ncbi:hypothetical protein KDH_14010 [Dictyobacter sp. S3.2.2.5]|uniref:Uncharacterized protein n=1 Tax=Dictyobacter halimunensis TaxID=3026934 RepID=A0ABQ6FNF8_9CHLR|nr:hypothetical protein KDH_14010 [Dictyobacter sp. S3.2.2.5]
MSRRVEVWNRQTSGWTPTVTFEDIVHSMIKHDIHLVAREEEAIKKVSYTFTTQPCQIRSR